MHLALAPALYRAGGIPEFTQIFIHDAMLNCCRRSSLQARPRQSPFAPTQGLHFQALHPLSLLFICTLHWCKHYTRQDVCPEFTQISIHGSMRNCCRRSSLHAHPRRCTFCTNPGFTFSGFPSLQLLFHMLLTLMQALYRARGLARGIHANFHSRLYAELLQAG